MSGLSVAIIPARGGSKRIPRKNIKLFAGKPIIAWSIQTALHSGCFDRVVVSTDDQEIAEVAVHYGAEVPFLRSAKLADDFAPTVPVIVDAIQNLEAASALTEVTEVCCIYPTAPLMQASDLQATRDILRERKPSYVLPVVPFACAPERGFRLNDGALEMIAPAFFQARSQDISDLWHDAGQFYWARASTWKTDDCVFSIRSYGFAVPRSRAQDIDTPDDWKLAEALWACTKSV